MNYKRYWLALAVVILGSFAVLGTVGRKMISQAPPIPDVYSADGQLLFSGSTITDGQGVWQSIGGQEIGTIWGHGAYVAPDWRADWLHRESNILLDTWAQRDGAASFASLSVEQQAALKARLVTAIRTNTYDAAANRVTLSGDRASCVSAACDVLRRCVCVRAQGVCDSAGRIDRPSEAAATRSVLLVECLGDEHEQAGIERQLYE